MPYAEDEATTDLIDLGSLEALLQGRKDVFPNTNDGTEEDPLFRVLPYDAGNAKTVGMCSASSSSGLEASWSMTGANCALAHGR